MILDVMQTLRNILGLIKKRKKGKGFNSAILMNQFIGHDYYIHDANMDVLCKLRFYEAIRDGQLNIVAAVGRGKFVDEELKIATVVALSKDTVEITANIATSATIAVAEKHFFVDLRPIEKNLSAHFGNTMMNEWTL